MSASSTCVITYLPDLAPHVRVLIEPLIERYAFLLPTWCHILWVAPNSKQENDATALSVRALYPRRFAKIWVDLHFVAMSDSDRELAVIHEMCHLLVAPLDDFAKEVIADFAPDKIGGRARSQHDDASEAVVSDMARMIQERLSR